MSKFDPIRNFISFGLIFGSVSAVQAWLPIKLDQLVFMPGSQPSGMSLESAARCDNCHGGYDPAVEPAYNWRGSMMANAARDPLWLACLTAALQDSFFALESPNAVDICVRCHTPGGWLAGRSDPPNLTLLTGLDFEGVNCDACHHALDPVAGLRQVDDLAPETGGSAISEANKTYRRDLSVLQPLALFNGTPFFDTTAELPTYFLNGVLPNYIEATGSQFVLDDNTAKRGPRYDATTAPGQHAWYYSRFHKTKYVCATCHDISNPALGRLLNDDMELPEKQAVATYVHVERTFSEFMLSAFAQPGGAVASPSVKLPPGTVVTKCQDCHMRDVVGRAATGRKAPRRNDLALHDQTGGNTWISGILASADAAGPVYDAYNYAILSGAKYPAAKVDVAGLQGFGRALRDGQARAVEQLQVAATLEAVAEDAEGLMLRIINNSGHKLISGFPEGRRMWLNVRFYNNQGKLLAEEVNPYSPLVVTKDSAGNEQYVSGGDLTVTRGDLVYEAGMSSSITGEEHTFHFALGTHLYKDNRIPPKGFQVSQAGGRLVMPRVNAADAPDYFTTEEYTGGYDEVFVRKPAGTSHWEAALYYQTTSKKYVEFLRDEIDGTAASLPADAYIVQTDAFFSSLKDWGKAIYDLWLHNGGNAPVRMTALAGP